ncbi:hypothetical protein NDA11_005763 [Ustilago hordei]|nr:hypothetical protein NDA15_005850 [Ustilago hordei]KAJ1574730.1 hypothetical protein NDA12_002574 [Ustilago hordei]KAJ1576738.1 hypothetical protein NDA11_005763 [Ustilago hordei]KAJ1596232.1 hypothetical protein NDA14_001641 [Ustilago hordei]UTT88860.1 hypothetical protein NDA17_000811 [Ustilago hordei]
MSSYAAFRAAERSSTLNGGSSSSHSQPHSRNSTPCGNGYGNGSSSSGSSSSSSTNNGNGNSNSNGRNGDKEKEKVTFASPEIKALSPLRSNKAYEYMYRSADIGQELQCRLARNPPRLFPEYEATRLYDYWIAWVEEWEIGHKGLAIVNPYSTMVSDVIPPWDFVWTDEDLLDPSVPPLDQLKPEPEVNGYKLTDELVARGGCNCEDDECDPKTCACLRRAANCYPHLETPYQTMFNPPKSQSDTSGHDATSFEPNPDFVYDSFGRLSSTVAEGTPIFECNDLCPCGETCRNRVVQKGKKVNLAFCKTETKGWGIKALEQLPRGTFVGVYGGELLSDAEAERRAEVYDKKLGTTYLQTVDSHIIKVHLTKKILERELAEKDELKYYRGNRDNERRMVELISVTADNIEKYDDYYRYLEDGGDSRLWQLELRIRNGTATEEEKEKILSQGLKDATLRANEQALAKRDRLVAEAPGLLFPEAIDPKQDYDDVVYKFLSLSKEEQEHARKMHDIRSDEEDQHFVTVDSALWGNHTRFFNHSCDPNILHVPVYISNASIMRPLLAFFTLRPVAEGEELCFAYSGKASEAPYSAPESPAKRTAGRPKKATTMHTPSTKPGADTRAAITATPANSAAATGANMANAKLGIKCACGAKYCTGRVFA